MQLPTLCVLEYSKHHGIERSLSKCIAKCVFFSRLVQLIADGKNINELCCTLKCKRKCKDGIKRLRKQWTYSPAKNQLISELIFFSILLQLLEICANGNLFLLFSTHDLLNGPLKGCIFLLFRCCSMGVLDNTILKNKMRDKSSRTHSVYGSFKQGIRSIFHRY